MSKTVILIAALCIAWCTTGRTQTKKLDRLYEKYEGCLKEKNYSCAWDWVQKVVDYSQRKYGSQHAYYAQALEKKATLYLGQKRSKDAQSLYKKACTIYQKHPNTYPQTYPNCVYRLAEIYLQTKQYSKAAKLCATAISISQTHQLNEQINYLFIQGQLATAWMKQRRLIKADSLFTAIAPQIKQKNTPTFNVAYGKFFNHHARCKWLLKDYKTTKSLYQANLKWVEEHLGKGHLLHKHTVEEFMKYYVYMVQNGEAIKLLEQNNISKISFLILLPYITHWTMVDSHFKNMWDFFHEQKLFAEQISEGSYLKKRRTIEQRFKVIEQKFGKDHLFFVGNLISLAGFYIETQYYTKAINSFNQAYKFLQNYDDYTRNAVSALIQNNKAVLYLYMGSFLEAQKFATISHLNIKKYIDNKSYLIANALTNLADAYVVFGNINKATILLNKAWQIIKNTQYHLSGIALFIGYATPTRITRSQIATLCSLAALEIVRGNLTGAEKRLSDASRILKKHKGYKGYFHYLRLLTKFHQIKKHYDIADSLHQEVITQAMRHYGTQHYLYGHSLHSYGLFKHKLKNYAMADSLYQKARKITQSLLPKNHSMLIDQDFSFALLKSHTKQNEEALSNFRTAITKQNSQLFHNFNFFNAQEKTSFIRWVSKMFAEFYHFSLNVYPQKPITLDLMYNLQLDHKGSLLGTFLKTKQRIFSSKNDSLIKVYQQWLDKKRLLNKFYTLSNQQLKKQEVSLEEEESQADALEKQWVKIANLSNLQKRQPLSWKVVQKKLSPGEAAIEIIRWYSQKQKQAHYIVLILTPYTLQHPHVIILKDKHEAKHYTEYLKNLQTKTNDFNSYQRYFAPIARYLKKYRIRKVYFAPDGIYNKINLDMLRDKNLGYVYQHFDIQLVTSTRTLLASKAKVSSKKTRSICFFGNPNFNLDRIGVTQTIPADTTTRWNRIQVLHPKQSSAIYQALVGTNVEVRQLADLAKANAYQIQSFVGNQALEEKVKSVNNPSILHIATHGYFREAKDINRNQDLFMGLNTQKAIDNPLLRSGLILAGANRALQDTTYFYGLQVDDGHLNAAEIANMSLDSTDLVVLSACETGQGQVRNGEGVYGLQRAFRVAGAKSILMSLWKVDDTATRQFMVQFYQAYFATGNKRRALKITRDHFRKHPRYYHPYYWGAFVLVGE